MNDEQILRYMTTKKYKGLEYDCWAFVQDVYEDLQGIRLPDYPVDIVPAEFKNKLRSNFKNEIIKEGQAKEGDIICFSLFDKQHAGIMLDKNTFIHIGNNGVQVTETKNVGKNYVVYRYIRED